MQQVSVILPLRNRFDLAHRAIESVLAQRHRPVQLIAVDDASSVPFEFKREHRQNSGFQVVLLRSDKNVGPGAAREMGRLRATGSFLAYLDSDDFWAPGFLIHLIQALEAKSDAAMAYCISLIDAPERKVCKRSDQAVLNFLPTILNGRPWHTSGCLWRRSATDAIGPWEPLWHWEDYEYDARAGAKGFVPTHLAKSLSYVSHDAPSRVSETVIGSRKIHSINKALRLITKHVVTAGLADSPEVKRRMRRLALTNAIEAIKCDTLETAHTSLSLAQSWSNDGLGARLLYSSVSIASFTRQKRLALHLARRLRGNDRAAIPELPHTFGTPISDK